MTELIPTGRFEWERIVRRLPLSAPCKLAALVLATYADPDGSRVRPGEDRVAAVVGRSDRQARRHLKALRDVGLIEQVSRGGGRGGRGITSTYRLTIPVDLMERFEPLPPDDRAPETPDIQVSCESASRPVDNTDTPDTDVSGQPASLMSGQSESPDIKVSGVSPPTPGMTGHLETGESRLTGHLEPIDRTSGCPTTTHRPTTNYDHPPVVDPVTTDPPPSPEPVDDPDSSVTGSAPAADAAERDPPELRYVRRGVTDRAAARARLPNCPVHRFTRLDPNGGCVACRAEKRTEKRPA